MLKTVSVSALTLFLAAPSFAAVSVKEVSEALKPHSQTIVENAGGAQVKGFKVSKGEKSFVIPEMDLKQDGENVLVSFPQDATVVKKGEERSLDATIDLSSATLTLTDLSDGAAGEFNAPTLTVKGAVNSEHENRRFTKTSHDVTAKFDVNPEKGEKSVVDVGVKGTLINESDDKMNVITDHEIGESALSLTFVSPGEFNRDDPVSALKEGLSVSVDGTLGRLTSRTKGEGQDLTGTSEPVHVVGNVSADETTFSVDSAGGDAFFFNPRDDKRLSYRAGANKLEFRAPGVNDADDRKVNIKMSVDDVVLDDGLHALVDPANKMSRDPMSFKVDLSGDLSAPLAEMKGVSVPFSTVTVNHFDFNGLGTMLSVMGSVMLDEKTGEPSSGGLEVNMRGVDNLVSSLSQGGQVPGMAVASYQMAKRMLNERGPDNYSADVEFTDGEITVNGQRVR